MKKFNELASQFDALLVDNYGVINFGSGMSAEAMDTLRKLHEQGIKVSILSNATYLSSVAEERYQKKGLLKNVHYDEFLTSGQFAYEAIQKGELPFAGKRYCVFGTANFQRLEDKIPDVFKGSSFEFTEDIDKADFVYCGVSQIAGEDRTEIDDFLPLLRQLLAHKLPMLCTNPDAMSNEGGRFVIRQGAICQTYKQLGGEVCLFGKPDPRIYQRALRGIGCGSNALMVGDTLQTDILGANLYGIKSCLTVKGGVTEEMMRRDGFTITEDSIRDYSNKIKSGKPDFIVDTIFA